MPDNGKYGEQLADIATRAHAMKSALVEPFRNDDGSFLRPSNSAEAEKRNMILESATSGSAYEMTPNGKMIAAVQARALQGYEAIHGHLPSDDLLANAHRATENVLSGNFLKNGGGIFESADMSTSEGIIMRDRMVALILPVSMHTITSGIVSFMPGEFNQSEFFRVRAKAASTFGSVTKDTYIEGDYAGQYSGMDQRVALGTGDGSTKVFAFDSVAKLGVVHPFKKKRTCVYVDRAEVATDAGLSGSSLLSGTYNNTVVSGTVDYAEGKVTVTFAVAPANGIELHLGFDVDIEAAPTLIPRITHEMDSRVLYPHEYAITSQASIQAIWALRREMGQDVESMNMRSMRDILAADKDRKHLNDMYFCSKKRIVEWDRKTPAALTLREHREGLQDALLTVDSQLVAANKVAGLTGLVAGTMATNTFRALPSPDFTPAPNYRFVARPHYVGRLYGQWDLYCDPLNGAPYRSMCYARGTEYGRTAYLAGDAIPALSFKHPVMYNLTHSNTMWGLAYRSMQPFDGQDYLGTFDMVEDD